MKIKLSIIDRINFSVLFPQQGTILIQMIVRDISSKIEISADESKKIELKQVSDKLFWNVEKAGKLEKDFEFSEAEINFLKGRVDEIDKEGKVTLQVLDLFNKIKEAK